MRDSRMLRASLPSSERLSVRLSVCLSHSWSVSIRCKLGSRNLHCGLWARASKRGTPLKRRHFAFIGSNNVKTVADRHKHAAYHNKHWWQTFWLYQHRWPWTTLNSSKRGFWWIFRNFWMQSTIQHWIATKWPEIDQDNLRMKFSTFNVDFSSLTPDPLGSRRPAQTGVKDSYPPKKWLF